MKYLLTLLLFANISFAENCTIFEEGVEYPNPIFFKQNQPVGKYGTEWLPKRKFVKVKLTPAITEGFSSGCYVVTDSGQREYLDYIKTDCKGRQVYKTSFSCDAYKSIKVTCEEEKQTVVFRARGKKKKDTCAKIK